jgi:hypothetical protein
MLAVPYFEKRLYELSEDQVTLYELSEDQVTPASLLLLASQVEVDIQGDCTHILPIHLFDI